MLDIVILLWQLSGVGPVLCSLRGKTFQIVYCHEKRRILQTNSSRHGAASSCAQKQQHRPTQKVPNRMLFARCIAYRTSSVDSSFYAQASQHKLMACVLHGCPILESGNNHSSPVECTFNRTGKKSLSCRRLSIATFYLACTMPSASLAVTKSCRLPEASARSVFPSVSGLLTKRPGRDLRYLSESYIRESAASTVDICCRAFTTCTRLGRNFVRKLPAPPFLVLTAAGGTERALEASLNRVRICTCSLHASL